ncbi:suppressor of fused domain protein [Butyrivibrio sp. XPD2006]|uniref:suppressor of fused domain protein n=1 Tax=Butyrivibrio sp. XPD2006 TaxID=1280668 RepID=UPI00040B6524|nr:suppressor of fused domain protein [Butyrivibrio sp. XPD2006]
MEPEVLIEEWSPVADIQAFVEKSDKNYYFYLWVNPHSDEPEVKACWICNRVKAPVDINEAFANEGEAPCMPAEFVDHDPEGVELNKESLSIEWFEEGDSAAVLSDGKIIAVIPSFSGYKSFPGYSKYAKGTGPFAWELKNAYSRFESEVNNGRAFRSFFDQEDYWPRVQDFHMNTLYNFFGEEEKYYAIDGGQFPPKALVQGRKGNTIYGITLGVSMIPMPKVEMAYQDDYKSFRRIELGFACNEKHEELLRTIIPVMSGLSSYPWKYLTFFGHGHTIPFNNIKGYEYILFLNDRLLKNTDSPKYADFMGESINLLWLVPITQSEQEFIEEKGVEEYLKDKDGSRIYIFGDH